MPAPALVPRSGDQAFMGASSAMTSSTPYRLPAYPGTQINHPAFNLTYPRADSYYAAQLTKFTRCQIEYGDVVCDNFTRWASPPFLSHEPNRWPAIWEMQGSDASDLPKGGNAIVDGFRWPETPPGQVQLFEPNLDLMRYDPMSDMSRHLGGYASWNDIEYCRYSHDQDRPVKHKPSKPSCVLDMTILDLHYWLENGTEPGDNYFLAFVNVSTFDMSFLNYISVSELFSIRNSSTLDPKRPKWVSGAAHASIPSAVVLFQVVLVVLVLSTTLAWV